MLGIYSQYSPNLSKRADLQSCLESRLQARLDVNGSPEYRLRWTHWDMSPLPPICALRVSAHPTSDSGYTGWPTPLASDKNSSRRSKKAKANHSGERLTEAIGAETGKGGAPHARFVALLMGYPATHYDCGVTAMPSSRRLRQNLSKQLLLPLATHKIEEGLPMNSTLPAASGVQSPPSTPSTVSTQSTQSTKLILDACCGSRMFWFPASKKLPCVEFQDIRQGDFSYLTNREEKHNRIITVAPTHIGDFTKMSFPDETFYQVVFDPPHGNFGESSFLAKKYGVLVAGWEEYLRAGFSECFRVLKPHGTLIFKWSECHHPTSKVFELTDHRPLYGYPRGNAIFAVFMKGVLK
jgi:SAM-dependent methyltransferase